MFITCTATPEVLSADQGAEVQRVHPQPGGADQPQPGPGQTPARDRAGGVHPNPGVPGGTTCSAAIRFHRVGAAATLPPPAACIIRASRRRFAEMEKSWKPVTRSPSSTSRSEMNTQFANIATPSEVGDRRPSPWSFRRHGRTALPAVLDDGADPRRALQCHAANEAGGPTSGDQDADAQLQTAEVELVASLGAARSALGDTSA